MPAPALIPGQMAEAQGRSFRNLYPRQVRGLLYALAGGAVAGVVLPFGTPAGFLGTFLCAVPGMAYGFYRPAGKPVEHWMRVALSYHLGPRVATYARKEVIVRARPAPGHRRLV